MCICEITHRQSTVYYEDGIILKMCKSAVIQKVLRLKVPVYILGVYIPVLDVGPSTTGGFLSGFVLGFKTGIVYYCLYATCILLVSIVHSSSTLACVFCYWDKNNQIILKDIHRSCISLLQCLRNIWHLTPRGFHAAFLSPVFVSDNKMSVELWHFITVSPIALRNGNFVI